MLLDGSFYDIDKAVARIRFRIMSLTADVVPGGVKKMQTEVAVIPSRNQRIDVT